MMLKCYVDKRKLENQKSDSQITNVVKNIYEQFTDDEISNKISEIVTDKTIKSEVCVIYQALQGLYNSIPNHTGDWYFSGNYPTSGGMRVANTSFINYYEKNNDRSY